MFRGGTAEAKLFIVQEGAVTWQGKMLSQWGATRGPAPPTLGEVGGAGPTASNLPNIFMEATSPTEVMPSGQAAAAAFTAHVMPLGLMTSTRHAQKMGRCLHVTSGMRMMGSATTMTTMAVPFYYTAEGSVPEEVVSSGQEEAAVFMEDTSFMQGVVGLTLMPSTGAHRVPAADLAALARLVLGSDKLYGFFLSVRAGRTLMHC